MFTGALDLRCRHVAIRLKPAPNLNSVDEIIILSKLFRILIIGIFRIDLLFTTQFQILSTMMI